MYSIFADFDVACADFADGKWGEPRSIVPKNEALRYADFDMHPRNSDVILAICEDHTKPAPADVVNSVVIIDASKRTVTPFATGHDFYAAPRWSADGSRVIYVRRTDARSIADGHRSRGISAFHRRSGDPDRAAPTCRGRAAGSRSRTRTSTARSCRNPRASSSAATASASASRGGPSTAR